MTVITWDYKEQPDWAEVNFALVEQIDFFIHEVESGTDQFAIVIGPRDMRPEEAQAEYDKWYQEAK